MTGTLASRIVPGFGPLADPDRMDPEVVALAAGYGSDFTALLAGIRAGSPFLWGLALGDPDRLGRLAAAAPGASLDRLVAAQAGLGEAFGDGSIDRAALVRGLRRNRAELALLVALADLGGVWTVDEVVAALSRFADASVTSAVAAALAEAAQGGKLAPDALAAGRSGLVVLALGKHGAGELNYSSDIDLVVFYDPAAEGLREGAEPARLYNRAAQAVVKLLSERTPDGYVHRVDYRLRPDPGSTPAAVSLPSAYGYYETVGQNWERAAMIKARPVAGDLDRGRRFLADLDPFIWRKYFDFAAIADIHAMKRQIHAVRGHDEIAVAGHDIKLGRGGIREVEFFVQTQQLVFGGRRRTLRGRRTLDMLAALEREGWITPQAQGELAAAYRFLRTIEHRLQMVADEQTQRLPQDPVVLARFARFAGYADTEAFAADLTAHAGRVQHHYRLLFEDAPELALAQGDLVFTGTEADPATLDTLRRLGFREPGRAAETVRGWHFGRRPAIRSPRAREVMTELVPLLLDALGGTGDPDGGLAHLDHAFGRMPAAVELLTILRSHERLRLLFCDLLGSAPRLADDVAARPHLLDAVIEPGFAEPARDEDGTEQDFRALVGTPRDTEEFLERTRDAAHRLQFMTGARMLSGLLPPEAAGEDYAAIARAAIRISLDWARSVFETEHGRVPGGAIVVLGLGRLGARNLTATSDLDLVILYDFDPERRVSAGARPLDAVVYFTRLAQRLIAALTAPTRRGRLFDVDMRLRPSGTKGPVATQVSGFGSYHEREAELWEHMALTRARVVAGDPQLAADVDRTITLIVARSRDRAEVFRAVASMRALVAREKGEGDPRDLKLARGGLLDLDFMAQAMVLAHAAEESGLIGLSTPTCLQEAGRLGLIGREAAETLAAAHRVFDDILHWQRLTIGDRLDEADRVPLLWRRLSGLVGSPDPGAFMEHLADTRRPVREIFDRVLGSAG